MEEDFAVEDTQRSRSFGASLVGQGTKCEVPPLENAISGQCRQIDLLEKVVTGLALRLAQVRTSPGNDEMPAEAEKSLQIPKSPVVLNIDGNTARLRRLTFAIGEISRTLDV